MAAKGRHRLADRVAEAAAAAFAAAAVLVLSSGPRGDVPALPDARPSPMETADAEAFTSRFDEARRLVDGNRDAQEALASLKDAYPGRHEVWALSARHQEARLKVGPALMDYAYAVRLEPAYLDDGSTLYLGDRISRLVETGLDLLRAAMAGSGGSVSEEDASALKAAYFLKRRLAGGCE